jgi:hypothetical protein
LKRKQNRSKLFPSSSNTVVSGEEEIGSQAMILLAFLDQWHRSKAHFFLL